MAGVFTKYPTMRYHKDVAPEGIEVRNAEQEAKLAPADQGWVDTPAKFDPAYRALTADPPEGTPFETYVVPAKPPVPYPAMRYGRGGEERVINSPDQEEAGWQDHPWTPAELAVPPAATHAPSSTEQQEDKLFSVTVAQVEEILDEITDLAELDSIAAREQRNPRGPRKGILMAIDARRGQLVSVEY